MSVVVRQQGAGNGKSYDLIRSILAGDADAIVLTKPHTNKDLLYAEIMRATDAHARSKNRAWIVEFRARRAVFATVDSFMFAIGDPSRGGRTFDSAVRSVDEAQLARTVPYDEDGAWLTFKGERIRVDGSVVFVDEAQDLGLEYVRALTAYARYTGTRVVLIGDKLQSIQHEENAFTVRDAGEREPAKNVCRRFGPRIALFVNKLIFFDEANALWTTGLAPIATLAELDDHEGRVVVTKVPSGARVEATATVERVMHALAAELERFPALLPGDVLVVAPLVRNRPVMESLEMHISAFWAERGFNDAAFLHVSEPGHPVNLEHSRDATRLVSIHASKGDGRRVVFVVGLTERAMSRFSDTEVPSESLVYLSLLHVALTRAMRSMHVFLHDGDDDITRRFIRAGLVPEDWVEQTRGAAWVSRRTLLRDTINNEAVSTLGIQPMLSSIIAVASDDGAATATSAAYRIPMDAPFRGASRRATSVSDAVHHYIEYSCMVIGAIMHVVDSCRTKGALAGMFSDVRSRLRAVRCVDVTAQEYARKYIIARSQAAAATSTSHTDEPLVPIVRNPRSAQLRALVEETKTRPRPVTPLDMCVTLYVLGHAYPNMIDRTRGMYRPLAMYRVLGWLDGAPRARTDTDWGQHSERLARLDALMRSAIAFAGETEWWIDYQRPCRISPVDEFDLEAQHSVLFRFKRATGLYVVHLWSRFHSDPYTYAIEALVDSVANERREGKDSECLVIALDAPAPFVVRTPPDQKPLLDFTRLAMRAHYARLNSEISRGIVKTRIPPYARRAIARGATDPASLSRQLDAAIDAYVDHIFVRSSTVNVTDVADHVPDDAYESEPMGPVFVPYTGPSLTLDQARACGEAGPALAFEWLRAAGVAPPISPEEREATHHAARAARAALDSFCVRPRSEVAFTAASPFGSRTLLGRVDALDERGVVLEFKLNVKRTAMRQLACYLAMTINTGHAVRPATGYVVGLHDAVVYKVVVRDPWPILAACFRFD